MQTRRRGPAVATSPRRLGDLVIGDHLVMPSDDSRGSGGESACLLLEDMGTGKGVTVCMGSHRKSLGVEKFPYIP